MNDVVLGFNARMVEPNAAPEAWHGWFPLVITGAARKKAKESDNERLVLNVTCIDGPHKGKENQIGFNLWNANAEASRIAASELSALCWVVGVLDATQASLLFNKPFLAKFEKTDKGQNVKDYRDVYGRNAKEVMTNAPPTTSAAELMAGNGAANAALPAMPSGPMPGAAPAPMMQQPQPGPAAPPMPQAQWQPGPAAPQAAPAAPAGWQQQPAPAAAQPGPQVQQGIPMPGAPMPHPGTPQAAPAAQWSPGGAPGAGPQPGPVAAGPGGAAPPWQR